MVNPIIQALQIADKAYFNKKPIMSDRDYDLLYQAAERAFAGDAYFNSVGATPTERKVNLPVTIPKMPQFRPADAIAWCVKHKKAFVVEAKIDGIAGQLTYKKGKLYLGATRGDGSIGQNVTENAKHIVGVWPTLKHNKKDTVVIHGEFTMHRSVFAKINNDRFANTRAVCSGMLRRDDPDIKILNQMVFVAYGYEILGKPKESKYQQTSELAKEGFITVNNCGPINQKDHKKLQAGMDMRIIPLLKFEPFQHSFQEKPPTKEWILATLEELRKTFDLDLDGLVFTLNERQTKNKQYNYKVKPDVEDQEKKRGIVKDIEYEVSARNLRKPVLVLEKPLNFNGTQVKRCTLHNFSYVVRDKIGPGSVVELIRSGDVIPRYMRTITATGFKQPKRCKTCSSKLIFNGTDLLCDNPACIAYSLPRLVNFFKKLKVEEMGESTVATFAEAGYNTVAKIVGMQPATMAKLDRLGEKSAATIIKNLKATMSKWKLHEFMAASGIFSSASTSLGETLLEKICEKFSLSEMRGKLKKYQIVMPQIGPERAELFLECLPEFLQFYDDVNRVIKLKFAVQNEGVLGGMRFAFTNFRDNDLERLIKDNGGKVDGLTLSTNVLFSAGPGTKQSKAEAMKKKGMKIQIVPSTKAKAFIENLLQPF